MQQDIIVLAAVWPKGRGSDLHGGAAGQHHQVGHQFGKEMAKRN
jgi:hypothetical protein